MYLSKVHYKSLMAEYKLCHKQAIQLAHTFRHSTDDIIANEAMLQYRQTFNQLQAIVPILSAHDAIAKQYRAGRCIITTHGSVT